MIIFQLILILFSVLNIIILCKTYKRFHCIYPIIAVFDFVMVVPIILEMILGIPNIPVDVYYNYIYAMNDQTTLLIYCIFILFAQLLFFIDLLVINNKDKYYKRNDSITLNNLLYNFKYKNIIIYLCYLVIIISLVAIAFSPDPLHYFKFRSVHDIVSNNVLSYNTKIISPIFTLLIGCIILLKLFSKNNHISGVLGRSLLIAYYTMVNGKRTYFMIIVGTYFLIDLLKSGSLKKIFSKYLIVFGITAIYFWSYMYLTDKIDFNGDFYYELHEYIFRSMHMRYAIYAVLNPDKIHILDYPGQSILYSIFFFVPRQIWPNKPYAYIDYYMMGLLDLNSPLQVTYHMPASYYPEFVSNFGLIGLPLSIIFTILISKYFDKKNLLIKLLGTGLIALLNIYYYNDLLKVVAIFILVLCIIQSINMSYRRRYRYVVPSKTIYYKN